MPETHFSLLDPSQALFVAPVMGLNTPYPEPKRVSCWTPPSTSAALPAESSSALPVKDALPNPLAAPVGVWRSWLVQRLMPPAPAPPPPRPDSKSRHSFKLAAVLRAWALRSPGFQRETRIPTVDWPLDPSPLKPPRTSADQSWAPQAAGLNDTMTEPPEAERLFCAGPSGAVTGTPMAQSPRLPQKEGS